MQKRRFFYILFLIYFPILVQSKTLNIVTSIPPVNALTAGITEGISEPTLLIPFGVSHHNYTFKPSTMRALQNADVLIWIGPNLETFLQKPIANLSDKTTVITIEKLPSLITYPLRNNANWIHVDEHDHPIGIDPHVWLDPQNAIMIIENLSAHFIQLDPDNSKTYQSNAKKMIAKIKTLDQKIKLELDPYKAKAFLVFHDGYQYFEKHYHLNAVGSVALDSDLPPSAQRLYQLQEKIKQEKIMCLFTEPHMHSSIVDALTRDTGIHVATLDTVGQGKKFEDYLNLLQTNAAAVKKCLTITSPSKEKQTP